MSKDIDTRDLFKGDTFRTAFLSEMVDFVCEKKPQNLLIRDLEYAKIVRCRVLLHGRKERRWLTLLTNRQR